MLNLTVVRKGQVRLLSSRTRNLKSVSSQIEAHGHESVGSTEKAGLYSLMKDGFLSGSMETVRSWASQGG